MQGSLKVENTPTRHRREHVSYFLPSSRQTRINLARKDITTDILEESQLKHSVYQLVLLAKS